MSGNIPVVTTTFEAGLQAKINSVNGLTPIEDIIALVRSGELITTIDNTPIQTELQLRMDAVDVNTETEKYIELAAAYGKITNTLAGGGGGARLQAIVKPTIFSSPSVSRPLVITPPDADSFIKLTLLSAQSDNVVNVGGIIVGDTNLLSTTIQFSNKPTDTSNQASVPSLFTISANFSNYRYGVAFHMQHLGAVIAPIVGGRGEEIKITISSGNSNLIYAYEVWK